ncbi:MAG: ArnT family glycosyltransferase [Gammaproteobacteria bacterium]
MYALLAPRIWLSLFWLLLMATTLSIRPLLPVDETRYVAVAWEMWARGDFLVPYLNGTSYSHKPPLLFWLMQMTWALFGVNEWAPRLIAPAFSLAAAFLSMVVARLLWPKHPQIAETTPFVLMGSFFWLVYSSLTMFDVMLSFFALLGIFGILRASRSEKPLRNLVLGLAVAVGGGVLTKGPVILLHVLPVALAAPWWWDRQAKTFNGRLWYLGILGGVLAGAAIAFAWAIPAGLAGGEVYRNAIFFGQTGGRMVKSFAHRLPWWWYLQVLPLLLLPWLLWMPLWRGVKRLRLDNGLRFCIAWLVPVLIAFSLISGKRIHYLLPLVPGAALLIARAVDDLDGFDWRTAHRPFVVLLAAIAVALLVLPWLNAHCHWQAELASISPFWGIALILCATALWWFKAGSAASSAFNIATSTLAATLIVAGAFFQMQGERYDMHEPAQKIAELTAQHKEVVYLGKYHGQFNFYGRLEKGLARVDNLTEWASRHPDDYIAVVYKPKKAPPDALIDYRHPFRNKVVALLRGDNIMKHAALFQ